MDHNFLFAVLKAFSFGPQFLQWVHTLFEGSQSCVMNNGFTTEYFSLQQRTRQGDLLLAYLFLLAIEVLLIQVREENEGVKTIKIGTDEVKLTAHADDIY